MPRRSYSPQQKAEALDLYRTDGPRAAATTTGIPLATIAGWAKANGERTRSVETKTAAVLASQLTWEQRRIDLAHDIGVLARVAWEKALETADAGKPRDAQSYATTMAIAIDKAQLLTGAAQVRVEHRHVDAVDAELADLIGQLRPIDADE